MPMAISAQEARNDLSKMINRVAYARDRVVIQRHGKSLVALVSMEDLATLEAAEDVLALNAHRHSVEASEGEPEKDAADVFRDLAA
jgi:prevent-host-death family protein